MRTRRSMRLVIAVLAFAFLPMLAEAQLLADPGNSSRIVVGTGTPPSVTYMCPTRKAKRHNCVFDGSGPYPIGGAGFAAGVNRAYNTPPEWKQGAAGYSKRF